MRVVLASHNKGKLAELKPLLAPLGLTLESQAEHHVASPEETGTTFVENALIKAKAVAYATGLPSLADDSGIAVPALQGAPGIRSARYAGPDATDAENNLKLMADITHLAPPVAAFYYCAIVYLEHANDPTPLIATAAWHGHLTPEPRGANGFGYDPYFVIAGRSQTSAELEPEEKNLLSHRGLACARLISEFNHRTVPN